MRSGNGREQICLFETDLQNRKRSFHGIPLSLVGQAVQRWIANEMRGLMLEGDVVTPILPLSIPITPCFCALRLQWVCCYPVSLRSKLCLFLSHLRASLKKGHGFTRAINNAAIDGFSHWGTFVPSSRFSYALIKKMPSRLKPSSVCSLGMRQ